MPENATFKASKIERKRKKTKSGEVGNAMKRRKKWFEQNLYYWPQNPKKTQWMLSRTIFVFSWYSLRIVDSENILSIEHMCFGCCLNCTEFVLNRTHLKMDTRKRSVYLIYRSNIHFKDIFGCFALPQVCRYFYVEC